MAGYKEWARVYFLFLMLLPTTAVLAVDPDNDVFYFQTDERYDYRTELLKLVLSYSEDEQPINLVPRPDIPSARAAHLMEKSQIRGILSLSTSAVREEQLLAIKIPIMAGILGMRVFLIHQDQQGLFSNIQSYSQLKTLIAGFGEHWGDLAILSENDLPVIPVTKYQSLFDMLEAKRFDYFPRGVNEIIPELKKQKEKLPNLIIEKDIAIYYPYPVYFFINKQDYDLARRLQYGLEQAQSDGSLKTLFLDHHQNLMEELGFSNRRIFNLENNQLPNDAKVTNKSWWMKP